MQTKAVEILYTERMAQALKSFDNKQGIYHPLSLYQEALKYELNLEIFQKDYAAGRNAFMTLYYSSKSCN